MRNVQTAVEQGDHLRAEQLLLGLRPAAGQADLRSFEWYYWWRQSHAGLVATVPLPPNQHRNQRPISLIFDGLPRSLLPEDGNTHGSLKATLLD